MDNEEVARKIHISVGRLPGLLRSEDGPGVREVSDFLLSEPRVFAVALVMIGQEMAASWKIPVADGLMLAPSPTMEEGPAKHAARLLVVSLNGDDAEVRAHAFALVDNLAERPDRRELNSLWLAVLNLWYFLLTLPLVAVSALPELAD